MEKNRPHSREKKIGTNSVHASKGNEIKTNGSVGNGSRGGNSQSDRPRSYSNDYDRGISAANRSSNGTSSLGIISLIYKMLPKKIRRILTLVLAIIIGLYILQSCYSTSQNYTPTISNQNQQSTIFDFTQATSQVIQPTVKPQYGSYYSSPYTSQVSQTVVDEVDNTVALEARDKRYIPVGNGKDIVTIMIYMCGTDLESQYGMATSDLQEMVNANISDNVNVIVQTGGCRRWKNSIISSSVNEIYKVESGGVKRLESDFGTAAMTDQDNLTDFIDYCTENYPADRNILILWDHGGGSISGYGYDEKRSDRDTMTLDEINTALKNADCTFDWIGFDACLMATLETAWVCNNYADYLIASEESEPGTGWYYTGWLNQISKNTSIKTPALAKTLIDDFVTASTKESYSAQVTLSIVDLAELQGTIPNAFNTFSKSITEMVEGNEYKTVSGARSGVRQFASSSKINQIDLIDFCNRLGTDEAIELANSLKGCIKYNNTNISKAYGISIYFPYESKSSLSTAIATYKSIGLDASYSKAIKSFASISVGGQVGSSAYQNPFSSYYSSSSTSGGSSDYIDIGSLFGSYSGSSYSNSSSSSSGWSSGSTGTSYSSSDILGALLQNYAGSSSSSSSASSSPFSAYGSLGNSYSNSYGQSSAGYSTSSGAVSIFDIINAFSSYGSSGRSMPSGMDWVDTELISSKAEYIADNFLDPGRITITEKNGEKVLELTDDEWDLINLAALNVYVYDGEGYIDLGLDNVLSYNDDNDLILSWDGTWLTVNGTLVAYYVDSVTENDDESWTTRGHIPALLNNKLVYFAVVFDDAYPYGSIIGAYPMYTDETSTIAKGNIQIEENDVIQFICDYYGDDGTWQSAFTLGDPIIVPSGGLDIENNELDNNTVSITYRLTDIYGTDFWTPAIIIE